METLAEVLDRGIKKIMEGEHHVHVSNIVLDKPIFRLETIGEGRYLMLTIMDTVVSIIATMKVSSCTAGE